MVIVFFINFIIKACFYLAVKKMMALAIEGAKKHGKPIGICRQAPSDLPEIASFLISLGIAILFLSIPIL